MAEQPPSKFPAQNSNSENQKTRKMNSEQVKEKEELVRYSNEQLIKEVIPIFDNLGNLIGGISIINFDFSPGTNLFERYPIINNCPAIIINTIKAH